MVSTYRVRPGYGVERGVSPHQDSHRQTKRKVTGSQMSEAYEGSVTGVTKSDGRRSDGMPATLTGVRIPPSKSSVKPFDAVYTQPRQVMPALRAGRSCPENEHISNLGSDCKRRGVCVWSSCRQFDRRVVPTRPRTPLPHFFHRVLHRHCGKFQLSEIKQSFVNSIKKCAQVL